VAIQIRRAGKKTLFAPGVSAIWHAEDGIVSALPAGVLDLLAADWTLGAATYGSKHFGAVAGLKVRIVAALGALFTCVCAFSLTSPAARRSTARKR